MTLNWLREVVESGRTELKFADLSALVPPKSLTLQASNMDKKPARFEVFQCYDSLTNMVLRKKRLPELTSIGFKVDAVARKGKKYHSEHKWELPTHRKWLRSSTAYVFMAEGNSERSAPIRSARKGTLTIEKTTEGGLSVPIPHLPAAVPGIQFKRFGKGKVVWAVDPVMRVDVITGSDLAEHTINLLRSATEFNDDLRAQFESDENAFLGELNAFFRGPADWSFEVPAELSGDEGGTSEFDISLVAESAGRGYFALKISDPNNPDESEISPGFSIEINVEQDHMILNMTTDFTDMEMPEVAIA